MGIIEKVSNGVSEKLGNRLNKSDEEKAVLNYGLFVIIHTGLAVILTFIVGLVTNRTLEIMSITLAAAWMKRYSGGVHATSPNRCLIVGIIVSFILLYIEKEFIININNNVLIAILVIGIIYSYLIIYYKCPVGTKNKPLKKEETRKRLRKKAFKLLNFYSLIIALGYLTYISSDFYFIKNLIVCIFLGLVLQASMLTKFGQRVVLALDSLLIKIKVS